MRVRIDVPGWVAVCFAAPVVRTHPTERTRVELAYLGPDLCVEGADIDACLAAMARLDTGPTIDTAPTIGEALLDQRIANGVGNVFKSEVCWAESIDPRTPVGLVPLELRRRLLRTANRLLLANLGPGPRRTVAGGLAVYGRAGRPCRRCGTPVRSDRTGRDPRVTYWCPTCQRRPGDRGQTNGT
jgi:endonuclease-8